MLDAFCLRIVGQPFIQSRKYLDLSGFKSRTTLREKVKFSLHEIIILLHAAAFRYSRFRNHGW